MKMYLYLMTYDVNTKDKEGQRRLRKVAKCCESRGCRVQKSVFECRLSIAQFEELRERILAIMDLSKDSLRVYRLTEPHDKYREHHGVNHAVDFTAPLIF